MSDTPKDDDNTEDGGATLGAEIMDRAERIALKAKAKAKAASKKTEIAPDEVEIALANSKMAATQKLKRKKLFTRGGALAGLALFSWFAYGLFVPYKAGLTFGVCKVFLELHVQFPKDLRISTVDDFGDYVRIWYTQLDAFGEYRMESIQCNFRPDEVMGSAVERITINRREVDPERVELFNKILPVILQNPPDLTIPYPLPDSLKNLQIETDLFRKPIL
ncbi:MAG: hypothetical protein R3E13_11525 [Alphaproteobacteria bacterium]